MKIKAVVIGLFLALILIMPTVSAVTSCVTEVRWKTSDAESYGPWHMVTSDQEVPKDYYYQYQVVFSNYSSDATYYVHVDQLNGTDDSGQLPLALSGNILDLQDGILGPLPSNGELVTLDEQFGIHAMTTGPFYLTGAVIRGVPEPATIALTMMGMLAIIGFVWSRKEE
jgi:hypothetical protein